MKEEGEENHLWRESEDISKLVDIFRAKTQKSGQVSAFLCENLSCICFRVFVQKLSCPFCRIYL